MGALRRPSYKLNEINGRPSAPFGALRRPSAPFGALRRPSAPFGALRRPSYKLNEIKL